MSEVKALYPIGKTQWAKWNDPARNAYNSMRAKGYSHETGVAEANAVQGKHKSGGLLGALRDIVNVVEDVAEVAETAVGVVEAVTPMVAIAKTVVKATTKKKAK